MIDEKWWPKIGQLLDVFTDMDHPVSTHGQRLQHWQIGEAWTQFQQQVVVGTEMT